MDKKLYISASRTWECIKNILLINSLIANYCLNNITFVNDCILAPVLNGNKNLADNYELTPVINNRI